MDAGRTRRGLESAIRPRIRALHNPVVQWCRSAHPAKTDFHIAARETRSTTLAAHRVDTEHNKNPTDDDGSARLCWRSRSMFPKAIPVPFLPVRQQFGFAKAVIEGETAHCET